MTKLHGPHLLRDFYRDMQTSRQEAREADNSGQDTDPRVDRIELGNQQTIVTSDGLVLSEPNMVVWLKGACVNERFEMDQQGYVRDKQGSYEFPLQLTGPGDKPFDPPDAQRVAPEKFDAAVARFEDEWNMT